MAEPKLSKMIFLLFFPAASTGRSPSPRSRLGTCEGEKKVRVMPFDRKKSPAVVGQPRNMSSLK